MFEEIGKLRGDNLAQLKQWLDERRSLLEPTVSTYAKGRWELWLKLKCDLRKQPTLTPAYRDKRIEALGNRLLPGWEIGLVLLYEPGVQIRLHRDHTVFAATAASVNLGHATFLMAEQPRKGEPLKPSRFPLGDGDCIKFNTKMLHGVEPVAEERWCVGFWHLKPEYRLG